MSAPDIWAYRARPLKVVDGDTLDVALDAGFRNFREERLRLLGLNTPSARARPVRPGMPPAYSWWTGCRGLRAWSGR